MKLLLLFLLFHCVSPVKHRLMFMGVASSGLPNFPDFLSTIVSDDTRVGYCDSNRKTHSSILDKKTPGVDTELFNLFIGLCFETLPNYFDVKLNFLKNIAQLEAVHILQITTGCEWNDATGEFGSFLQYAYNGEDLFELDLKTLTWIAKSHQAVMIKSEWETEENAYVKDGRALLTNVCPEWLKKYVVNEPQQKRDLPSVSLLQRTPSSPVRCHVTGFYPNRGQLYWKKNGKEIHEYVEHGEILPNPDGTFQMSVDFNVSSIPLEDWGKYDCVFQQPGLGNITTKLDKAVIRTNRVSPTDFPSHVISGVVVGLVLLVALCISGFIFWKKKNNGFQPAHRSDQIEDNAELQSSKDEARTVNSDQTSSNEQNH